MQLFALIERIHSNAPYLAYNFVLSNSCIPPYFSNLKISTPHPQYLGAPAPCQRMQVFSFQTLNIKESQSYKYVKLILLVH
jgi:hypothetical protein